MDEESILLKLFSYPVVSSVLANAPLPDFTDEQFWEHNFVQVQDRPAKRIGIEFKTYIEFHRKEFPKGKTITDQDIIRVMHLTEKEASRMPLVYQYLKSRKTLNKVGEGRYKVLL
jgi:hypothetical protein